MSEHADTIHDSLSELYGSTNMRFSGSKETFDIGLAALAALETELAEAQRERDEWQGHFNAARRWLDAVEEARDAAMDENARLEAALRQIAAMPTSERNPDGDEQAAHSMQLVAQETLVSGSEGDSPRWQRDPACVERWPECSEFSNGFTALERAAIDFVEASSSDEYALHLNDPKHPAWQRRMDAFGNLSRLVNYVAPSSGSEGDTA